MGMRNKGPQKSPETIASSSDLKKQIVFRLGELFSGPGGLAWGAMQAIVETKEAVFKISHGWANDYEKDSCLTYTRNICPNHPETVFCLDVKQLPIESLPPIDAFAYGFPCNDFSVVGEQKGFNGHFGPLYTYGIKVLDFFKPKFFVAENVGGISSANEGKAFRKILSDLRSSGNGYSLTVHLYRFEDYGIPQTRHRFIIVGIDQTLGLRFKVPAPTTKNSPRTAKQALEDPPIPPDAANSEKTKQSQKVVERLKMTRPGENAWNADLPDSLKLHVKNTKLSQIYRRLHPDKPSYTITGSGGGGTHGYHYEEPRALTNRERARIQTFPDSFVFEGSKESVRKQIGMAVSPEISRIVFNSILKTFAGVSYPSIQASWQEHPTLFSNTEEEFQFSCAK